MSFGILVVTFSFLFNKNNNNIKIMLYSTTTFNLKLKGDRQARDISSIASIVNWNLFKKSLKFFGNRVKQKNNNEILCEYMEISSFLKLKQLHNKNKPIIYQILNKWMKKIFNTKKEIKFINF